MSLGSRYGGTATFGGGIRGLNLVNSRRCVVYSNVRRDFARSEGKKTIHNSPEKEKTETKGRKTREDGLQRRWLDSVNCATDFTGRRGNRAHVARMRFNCFFWEISKCLYC